MRVDGNYGSYTNYEPNSNGAWKDQPDFSEPPLKLSGDADHWKYPCDDADYYEQPGKLFRVMTPEQQEALFGNTARAMAGVPVRSRSATFTIAPRLIPLTARVLPTPRHPHERSEVVK